MSRLKPLPLHLQQLPFTVAQARRAGLTPARTRSRDLWTPSREIRLPRSGSFELLESCRAHTSVTSSSFISHITAAKIHGLFLPSRFEAAQCLDVARPRGESSPRRRHVNGRRLLLGPGDLVIVAGVPVTSVQRTLVDIASLLTLDELVDIADQIVCEHHSKCVPPKTAMVERNALNAYIAEHAGARGMRKLLAAMEWVRVGSDSPPETRLRLVIARSPLPDFEPNVEILGPDGLALVAPDLANEEYKTCAEYDGNHHFTPEQQTKDHDRDFVTNSLGWHQALINRKDMQAGELILVTKLARMLVRGGWPDPKNLAGQSLRGALNTRRDFQ
ncbi:hypothetical protein [Arthrobacter glacialis]|uniref:hypothetical protein n=1 Tax=Arthrobacter glacialis TaxID=1664 RepID=UPI0010571FF9|nr:hypothetical protein [Arthrobacter glacialis]